MSLMWMKSNAKWVIYIFGILILVGLVMMDTSGSYGDSRQENVVGVVAGQQIQAQEFQMEMKNYQRNEEGRTGKVPDGLQLVQMRENLFNYKVQNILLDKQFKEYQLHASVEEMQDYLLRNPKEVALHISRYQGIEKLPAVLMDSTIDQSRYENWLSQDSVYDRFSMRELELQLKSAIVPQRQLQQLMNSQFHNTFLEKAHEIAIRENRARIRYYYASTDSFQVSPEKFSEQDLKAYFEAHPDSFHFSEEAASLGYVKIELRPSSEDSLQAFEFAKELKLRAEKDSNFSEIATSYSDDPGSAESGGNLGGFQSKEAWVPQFAEVAFKLQPGEISDPVLTDFGYHIILCHGKQTMDGQEKVDASHILLKIVAGSETLTELNQLAEDVRIAAQKEGLESAAKEQSLTYEKSKIFEKTDLLPMGNAYVSGINSFAFSKMESKESISEPLQNDEAIYLLEKREKFSKGRNFERAKPRIRDLLVQDEKLALAEKELSSQKSKITALSDAELPPQLGRALLDSSGFISGESWLTGYGYAHPALFQAIQQKVEEWGEIRRADQAVTLAKVVERQFLTQSELLEKAKEDWNQTETYLAANLYQIWLNNLRKTVKIKNNLDVVYRT